MTRKKILKVLLSACQQAKSRCSNHQPSQRQQVLKAPQRSSKLILVVGQDCNLRVACQVKAKQLAKALKLALKALQTCRTMLLKKEVVEVKPKELALRHLVPHHHPKPALQAKQGAPQVMLHRDRRIVLKPCLLVSLARKEEC